MSTPFEVEDLSMQREHLARCRADLADALDNTAAVAKKAARTCFSVNDSCSMAAWSRLDLPHLRAAA